MTNGHFRSLDSKPKVFGGISYFVCIVRRQHELGIPTHTQYISASDMQIAEAFIR